MKLFYSTTIRDTLKSKQIIKKSLSSMLGDIAYRTAYEVKRNIPKNFKLRRQWVVQGIRFEKPKGEKLEAKVFSLDQLMEKHEDGSSFSNHASVQSKYLQIRGRKRGETPRELSAQRGYFINERGVFERTQGHTLRQWYWSSEHRSYRQRLMMKNTAEDIAMRVANVNSNAFVVS